VASLPLVRSPSPSEVVSPSSSALLASGASPSPFRPAPGYSSSCVLPERASRKNLSWRWAPLQSPVASLPPAPPCRHAGPPKRSGQGVGRERDPPLLGFLLQNATTSGAPFPAATAEPSRWGRGSPDPRRCRPQGSCPSRRIRPRSRIVSAPSRSPPSSVAPRRFAALFHAARALDCALQSFPLSGSRTRSRGPLLPCGFAFDRRRRGDLELARRFPRRADPLPRLARRRAGLRGRDDGSPLPLGGPSCAPLSASTASHPLVIAGLAGKRPARPLRSLAPPGSPFARRPPPWPG